MTTDQLRHAADLVISTQFGSTSMLQRKLGIGWARAVAVMDELEAQGVVGPAVYGRSRPVLIRADQLPAILDRIWPLPASPASGDP